MKKQFIHTAVLAAMAATAYHPKRAGDDGGISLNYSYDSLDQVPEAYRGLYSENNGKVVLSAVVGIKTQDDVNAVQEALRKERNDHKSVKDKLAKLGDREIDDVLTMLDRIPELEAAAKGADNIDERVAARLQQETAPLKRTIQGYETELETLRASVAEYQQRETNRDISDNVVKYATKTKVLPEAVDDVCFMARSIFEKNEDGNIVAKNGIPGVTPGITPEVWLTELRQSKPFYWPASNLPHMGTGGGHQGGNNPWSAEHWNMTEQGKIYTANPKKAEQLAAQAGTSIGGPKPAAK